MRLNVMSEASRANAADTGTRLARRVLLLGWDGADWDVIDPLVAAGRMPHLAKLISAGMRGAPAASPPGACRTWRS